VVFAEIDFSELDDKAVRRLFVGATRATMKLVLVISDEAADQLLKRKRSIDTAIDDGGGDEVMAKPIGDSLPNTRAEGLRSRRRFGQWGVC